MSSAKQFLNRKYLERDHSWQFRHQILFLPCQVIREVWIFLRWLNYFVSITCHWKDLFSDYFKKFINLIINQYSKYQIIKLSNYQNIRYQILNIKNKKDRISWWMSQFIKFYFVNAQTQLRLIINKAIAHQPQGQT